jgi:hypothetical protein
MKKATSSSANTSKGAKVSKTKSTKKPAAKKTAPGKQSEAAAQPTKAPAVPSAPFPSSPGAGLKGLNCDDTATSLRSGSKCTPKGTFTVSGFQDSLNSDSRATHVTWFVRERGIGLHYFPSVPKSAASHGCVRLEKKSVAQLIQSNSRIDLTSVVVDGSWTKPSKQW